MSAALTIAGTACTVGGYVLNAWGLQVTWRAFANDARFFELAKQGIVGFARASWALGIAGSRRLGTRLRRLLGRPTRVSGRIDATLPAMTVAGHGRVGTVGLTYSPLDGDVEVGAAVQELDERTRALLVRLSDLENANRKALDRLEGMVEATRRDLQSHVTRLEQQDRTIAVGGIVLSAIGLTLWTVGAVLVAVGALI